MVAKSNIAPFMKNILQFAENWHKAVQNQLRNDAHELVINALGVAAEKKKQYEQILSGKENEAKEELEAQLLTANQIKDENRALTRKVNEYVREQKQKLQKNISDLCRTGAENLRNQVRDLIDKGVTGGARLEEAYNDCAKEVLNSVPGTAATFSYTNPRQPANHPGFETNLVVQSRLSCPRNFLPKKQSACTLW